MINPKPAPPQNKYIKDDLDWKAIVLVGLGICILVFLFGLLVYALIPKTEFAKVDQVVWNYNVQLQQRTILHDAEWGEPWNKEVVKINCVSKFYGYRDCMCYNTSYTTGTGKNKTTHTQRHCSRCPYNRDWCEYDYVTWPTKQTWNSSGNNFKVQWPEYKEAEKEQRIIKSEKYTVVFVDKKLEKYEYHPRSLQEFKKYIRGGTWMIKISVGGNVEVVKE